jgi:hypothetical protein
LARLAPQERRRVALLMPARELVLELVPVQSL